TCLLRHTVKKNNRTFIEIHSDDIQRFTANKCVSDYRHRYAGLISSQLKQAKSCTDTDDLAVAAERHRGVAVVSVPEKSSYFASRTKGRIEAPIRVQADQTKSNSEARLPNVTAHNDSAVRLY